LRGCAGRSRDDVKKNVSAIIRNQPLFCGVFFWFFELVVGKILRKNILHPSSGGSEPICGRSGLYLQLLQGKT
jgi:hypothetical protein